MIAHVIDYMYEVRNTHVNMYPWAPTRTICCPLQRCPGFNAICISLHFPAKKVDRICRLVDILAHHPERTYVSRKIKIVAPQPPGRNIEHTCRWMHWEFLGSPCGQANPGATWAGPGPALKAVEISIISTENESFFSGLCTQSALIRAAHHSGYMPRRNVVLNGVCVRIRTHKMICST